MIEQARNDGSLGSSRAQRLMVISPATTVDLWIDDGSVPRSEAARICRRQALLLWPRLDQHRLARTRGDPWRIARLVARRTPRSLDEIVAMLTRSTPACPIYLSRPNRDIPQAARIVSRG